MARSRLYRGSGLFYWGSHADILQETQGREEAHETEGLSTVPTGPNCDLTFEQCVAFATKQDSIDDPEAFCGATEQN